MRQKKQKDAFKFSEMQISDRVLFSLVASFGEGGVESCVCVCVCVWGGGGGGGLPSPAERRLRNVGKKIKNFFKLQPHAMLLHNWFCPARFVPCLRSVDKVYQSAAVHRCGRLVVITCPRLGVSVKRCNLRATQFSGSPEMAPGAHNKETR